MQMSDVAEVAAVFSVALSVHAALLLFILEVFS